MNSIHPALVAPPSPITRCPGCDADVAVAGPSENARQEIELRQAQRLESIGSLAAGIAHEINTPIQFVGDSVHFLADAVTDLIEMLARYRELRTLVAEHPDFAAVAEALLVAEDDLDAAFIEMETPRAIARTFDGIGRVASIVHAMREFSHPGGARALADMGDVVRSAVTVCRNEYKNVAELSLDLAPLPPLMCERGDVGQVVVNLVVNAAHAIESRVPRDDPPRIDVILRGARDGIELVVRDNGDGIEAEVLPRIFDPFFTTKGPGRGTGQGLALAATVLDRHDGTIGVSTQVGGGTDITCWFPMGQAS
jgi:signal transduction histidine kinase